MGLRALVLNTGSVRVCDSTKTEGESLRCVAVDSHCIQIKNQDMFIEVAIVIAVMLAWWGVTLLFTWMGRNK